MRTPPLIPGLVMLGLVMLAGCAKAPPVPTDNYYRLATPPVAAPLTDPLTSGVILVRQIQGDGLRSERALLYSDDPQDITLKQYSYHLWTDAPPRMVQVLLAEYLRSAHAARMVVTELDADADLILSGKLKRWERSEGEGGVVVHVALELRLDDSHYRPLLLKDYAADVPVANAKITATVSAMNEGLAGIFAQFLKDAAATVKTQPAGQ